MGTIAKYLQRVSGKKTFKEIFFDTVKYALMDGKVAESTIFHGYLDDAKLIGTDQFGNQYYERLGGEIYGRHRWVVYANKKEYTPTSVPPEWHGWLHFINDLNPVNSTFPEPVYKKAWMKHPSGTPDQYLPKGSWQNPYKRNWEKYSYYDPNQQAQ